jgi:hypothetical protein
MAILPAKTKVKTPEFLDHLEMLRLHPSQIEGMNVRTDGQTRIAIPDEMRDLVKERRVTFANLAGIDFVITRPSVEEQEATLRKIQERPDSTRGKIYVRSQVESPSEIVRREREIRRGSKEHRKNIMFSKHRKGK